MNIALKIIGVLIILDGIVALIKPGLIKMAMNFFAKNKRIYLAAVIKAVFGLLFLFGASDQCHWPMVIMIMGILGLFGASLIVILYEKMKALMSFFANRGNIFWRLMSVVYLAFGALVIYSA